MQGPETSVGSVPGAWPSTTFGRLAELLQAKDNHRVQITGVLGRQSRHSPVEDDALLHLDGRKVRRPEILVETGRNAKTHAVHIRLVRTSHETNHGRTQQTARGLPHGWSMVTPSSLAAQSLTS